MKCRNENTQGFCHLKRPQVFTLRESELLHYVSFALHFRWGGGNRVGNSYLCMLARCPAQSAVSAMFLAPADSFAPTLSTSSRQRTGSTVILSCSC